MAIYGYIWLYQTKYGYIWLFLVNLGYLNHVSSIRVQRESGESILLLFETFWQINQAISRGACAPKNKTNLGTGILLKDIDYLR